MGITLYADLFRIFAILSSSHHKSKYIDKATLTPSKSTFWVNIS